MTTQKEIFFQYIMNERDRLEHEVIQLRQNIRYRDVDCVDCLELSLALERLSAFIDFSSKAIQIFNLSVPADYNTVSFDISMYKELAKKAKKESKKDENT